MSKRKIIILSVIVGVLALFLILFGAVFRLRKQTVVYKDNSSVVSSADIISTAGLDYGTSIFMLDKESAIENLESNFPYLKVIQIKTVNVVEVEIIVRERHETYYAKFNYRYYILDEDLKVLDILENEPTNLTYIDSYDLGITSKTVVSDFVGTEADQNLISSLYSAIYRTVKIDINGDGNTNDITRDQIIELIASISFDTGAYVMDGETVLYNRLILTTKYGTIIDIAKPESDLEYKVNACLSLLSVILDDDTMSDYGTIKYVYLDGGEASLRYSIDS